MLTAAPFIVPTDAAIFGPWLEAYARDRLSVRAQRTERGMAQLQPHLHVQPTNAGYRAELRADWLSDRGALQPLGTAVEFDVVRLGPDRCQVRATAIGHTPLDAAVLDEILQAVADAWPAASPVGSPAPKTDETSAPDAPTPVAGASPGGCPPKCSLQHYNAERLKAEWQSYLADTGERPSQADFAWFLKPPCSENTLRTHRKHIGLFKNWPPR
jgi:hypothetical protein